MCRLGKDDFEKTCYKEPNECNLNDMEEDDHNTLELKKENGLWFRYGEEFVLFC